MNAAEPREEISTEDAKGVGDADAARADRGRDVRTELTRTCVRRQAAQPPTDRQYRRFHRLKISDNGRTRVAVKILIAMKLAGGGGGWLPAPAKGP